MRAMAAFLALAWGLAVPLAPFAAAATAVDLELVLGVDVSGSVDAEEADLQRRGYVRALADARVVGAIRSGVLGRIAATYFEWGGEDKQTVLVGWTLLDDAASARAFSRAIAAAPRARGRYTSISGAIDFAAGLIRGNDFEGTRRVIDLSGDGPNNVGRPVTAARAAAVAAGLTVNGLPIVNDRPNRFGPPMPNLDLYYRNCVIGGPGAFIVVAADFTAFAVAIRRKLILEISGRRPPAPWARAILIRLGAAETRWVPPCDEGERRLQRRLRDLF